MDLAHKCVGDKVIISDNSHKYFKKEGRIVDIRNKRAMVLLDNPGEIIVILLSNIVKIRKK